MVGQDNRRLIVATLEDGRRRINFELYYRMLKAQNVGDRSTWLSCLCADIVFEAPSYSREGPIASGLAAMSDVFDGIRRTFSSVSYEVQRFIPAVDPDLVIAEVRGDNVVASTKNLYRNDYLFLVQCRNGKITRIFEYSNPMVYRAAVTPLEQVDHSSEQGDVSPPLHGASGTLAAAGSGELGVDLLRKLARTLEGVESIEPGGKQPNLGAE